MFKPIALLKREWVLVVGLILAAAAGFFGASSGLNTFLAIAGSLGVGAAIIICVRRPEVTPYLIVTLAVFDRELRLGQAFQLTTSTVVILILSPWFARLIYTTRSLSRFAVIAAGMLVLGLVVAALSAPQPELAWPGLLRWVAVLMMIGGLASLFASQRDLLKHLGLAVLGGGTVAGLFGLLQRSGHYWLVGPPYVADVTDSTFGYYTNFANCEAIAAVIGAGIIIAQARLRRRPPIVPLACTLVCLYMVLTSYSRGAMVVVVVGLLVILMKQVARPARFVSALGGLAAAAWIIVQLAPEYTNELIEKFTISQNGDIVRNQLQAGGYEVLLATPLGIGFNNFSSLVASGEVSSTLALAHAHNTFIQLGLDAGWIGGCGFLLLVGLALWRGLGPRSGIIVLAFCGSLAGALVQSAQDFFFFEAGSLFLFGLLIAGSLGAYRGETSSDEIGSAKTRAKSMRHV